MLTPDQATEFDQTIGNKLWRLENLYKIRDKQKRLSFLKLNNIQKTIWADIKWNLDDTGNIIRPINHFDLKYRQGGVSTFWLLFWLDDTIFHENTVTAIQADARESIGYLFEIIRIAHSNMPEQYRPALGEDSKAALSFPGINSRIFVSLAIKSTAIHNLHISEWAYCEDTRISMSLGACAPTSNITGETTGNGIGNNAYELYTEAKKGDSPFQARFVPWFVQEEYRVPLNGIDPATIMSHLTKDELRLQKIMSKDYRLTLEPEQVLFRRDMVKKHKSLFPEKYPETDEDAFLATGDRFFTGKKLMRLYEEAKDAAREHPPEIDPQENWIQWEKPTPKHIYVAGADPAEGLNGDYSVLKILCVTCRREAFLFRARCGVDLFYRECNKWGRLYYNALLAIERNNHGHAVLMGLDETSHYPNLYKEETVRHIIKANQNQVGYTAGGNEVRLGWLTGATNKHAVLDELKEAIEGKSDEDEDNFFPEITVLDQTLLGEALTIEEKDKRIGAIDGKHDDDIMATAIAFQMYKRSKKYVKPVASEGRDSGIFTSGQRNIT